MHGAAKHADLYACSKNPGVGRGSSQSSGYKAWGAQPSPGQHCSDGTNADGMFGSQIKHHNDPALSWDTDRGWAAPTFTRAAMATRLMCPIPLTQNNTRGRAQRASPPGTELGLPANVLPAGVGEQQEIIPFVPKGGTRGCSLCSPRLQCSHTAPLTGHRAAPCPTPSHCPPGSPH